jgi:two-component system, NarL family, nitrate/nitrite response regulator NarL
MLSTLTKPIRVLLIDDHVVMRVALRVLIENQPGLTVIGEAATRRDALLIAAREQPDIILLDLDLGDESGLDILLELADAAKYGRVIVLTGIRDSQEYRRAVRLGAMGLVLKDQAVDTLVKAIKQVHAGGAWLDSALVASVLAEASRAWGRETDPETDKIAKLTGRERAIIALLCEGLQNKQIAERLLISQTTVVHHLTSIYDKLAVANRLELMTYAYHHGLVQAPGISHPPAQHGR